MADKQNPEDGPSLELPSLGSLFRRNKKTTEQAPASTPGTDPQPSAEDFDRLVRGEREPITDVDPSPAADATATAAEVSVEAEAPAVVPVVEPGAAAAREPAAEPDPEAAEQPTVVVDHASQTEDTTTTEAVPAELPEHDLIDPEEEPDLDDLVDDRPEGAAATSAASSATAASSSGSPEAVSPAPTTTTRPAGLGDGPAGDVADGATDGDATDGGATDHDEAPARPARSLSDLGITLPMVDGRIAAAITGLVVGALAVFLTWGGMESCEAVRGTSSCGGTGIPILVVIMAVLVIVGGSLLAAWEITDPNSTSFLAVGLLAVIALLFLIDVIFSPAMFVVIPLVSVGTYLLSHYVTTRFIEEEVPE